MISLRLMLGCVVAAGWALPICPAEAHVVGERVAEMILNSATMKASYPGYEAEALSLASGANSQRL